MYLAKLAGIDLNYRDSRPANGQLGIKLGTWRLADDPELWVLDVKDGWAAVFWNEQIVYASNQYLEPVSSFVGCETAFLAVGDELDKFNTVLNQLNVQFQMLYQMWEDSFIIPQDEPNFKFRLSNEWGWLLPVKSNFLWSDEDDHVNRGSVLAWDVAQAFAANVWSPVHGRVVDVYRTQNDSDLGPGKYGSHVYIRTTAPDGLEYDILLAHLTRSRIYIEKGDMVTPQTLISHISLEGLTSDTHVHIEIREAPFSIRYPVSNFWDIDKMFYCHVCKVSDYI